MADGVVTVATLQSIYTADTTNFDRGTAAVETRLQQVVERTQRLAAAAQSAWQGTGNTAAATAGVERVTQQLGTLTTRTLTVGQDATAMWREMAQNAQAAAGIERINGQVEALQRQMQTLGAGHPELRFTTNGEAIAQQLTNLQIRLQELAGKPYSVELRANTALLKEDLARVQTQMRGLQAESITLNTGGATKEVENLGGVLGHLSGVALPLVGFTAVEAFKQAADAGMAWQTTLTELQNNTGVTTAQLNEMADSIGRVQSESNVSKDSLAEAEMHITNFGFRGAEATAVLEAAMKSASSTGGNTAKTAELLANAMHEYGNSAYTAQQAVDVLHVAAQRGQGTFEQFAEASGQAVGVAANLHVPLEQVTAAIAALTQHCCFADEATTQMVAALTHIINPAQEAQGELDRLSKATGIDLVNDFSAAGLSSRGFTGVLDDLHLAYQKMGYTEEQATQQTMQLLNAQRGGLGVATLLGTGAKDYTDTLTAMAAAMSGQTTPTQDAFNRSSQTTAYQLGVLGNNLDIAKTRLGEFATQAQPVTDALNTMSAILQNSNAGWKAVEADPQKYAGALDSYRAFVAGLPGGVLVDALLPKPEDLEKRAQEARAAAAQGLSDIRADVQRHAEQEHAEMAAAGQQVVADVNKAWHDAQAAQLATMHQMNDEAGALAIANADAVYDPHVTNVQRMAQVAAQEAEAYINTLVKSYGTGQPAVDAYLTFLIKRHDLKDALAIMGHNSAVAFLNSLVMPVASGLEKMAASFSSIGILQGMPGMDALVGGIRKASQTMVGEWGQMTKQWDGFTGGFDAGAVKVEAAHKKAAKSAEAAAKAAEAAARQEVASTETIVRALESAGQQTDANAKGIGQSLVTLMGLLKTKIPPDMAFVRDAITRELAAAGSAAPPTVQKLHDDVVGILQRLKTDSRQEVRLMAQAALEQLGDFSTGAAAKMADAAAKVDAQALKMRQSLVKALGSLGDTAADPKGNIADFLVQALDVQKQAMDAQQPEIAAAASRWIDLANSANPPKLATMETDILGTLQAIATGSDPIMAAWARSVIGHIQETQAQAAAQAVQLQQTLVGALDTGLANTGSAGTNTPTALLNIISAMKAAQAAGMGDMAADLQRLIDGIRSGAISGFTAISQAYQGILQQMAQSTDQQTALMAQQALAHYQEIRQAAEAAAMQQATALQQQGQQAAEAAIQQALAAQQAMAQAAQGLPAALEPALAALQGHTKSALDVLVSLAPLATQAAQAGMPGLAAVIQQYMDQAKNGVALDGQQMYQSLMQYLQQMATDGDATLSAFAQNAIAHLQQAQAIQQAQASLVPYQAAVTAAQQRVQDLTQAVTEQQNAFNSIKGQIDAANQAIADFARGPLQGENQFAVQMHENEMATERLRQRLLQLPSSVGSNDPRRAGLERQIAELERRRQLLQSQYNTSIGDERFNLQQQANTTPETSYQDASAGITAAKDKVAQLTPALQAAQDRLVALQRQQAAAQEASQAAAAALAAQQQAVQALTTALQNGQAPTAAFVAGLGQTQAAVGQFAGTFQTQLGGVTAAFDAVFGGGGGGGAPGGAAGGGGGGGAGMSDQNILMKLFAHEDTAFFHRLDSKTNEALTGYAGTWAHQLTILDERVTDGLTTLRDTTVSRATAIGSALIQGMQQPVMDGADALAQAAAAAVTQAIEAARAAAGNPHSPSPTMAAKVGVPLAQGITAPLEAGAAHAASAGAGMVQAAQQGAAGQIVANAGSAPVGGGVAAPSATIPIIINADGMTTHDLTRWRDVGREISTVVMERVTALFPNSQIATLMQGGTI